MVTAPHSPLAFCPTLEEIVATGHSVGRSGKHIDVHSLSTVNNLVVLRNLHLEKKARNTLEIGLFRGGSTLTLCQTHKDFGHPPQKQHVAIDPWQFITSNDGAGLYALERANLSEYLDFRDAMSSVALPQLMQEARAFDLIYVDGSHVFENVFIDFYYCARMLTSGGLILFDDSATKDVSKVLRYIRRNQIDALQEIDLSPYRPTATLAYRVAHSLGKIQLCGFRRVGDPERPWDSTLRGF